MALTKRTYVDGETIITAQNLNDIQDEIIAHESNKVPTTRTVNGKALSNNITLNASNIPNDSAVSGANVDDALETLNSALKVMGVYPNIGMFERVGVLGDSFASGAINGSVYYNESWGRILGNMYGIDTSVYAFSGARTKQFLDSSNANYNTRGYGALLADNSANYLKCGLYLICFGINDANADSTSSNIGSSSDIKSDPEQNNDTFWGNYGKLIARLQSINSSAKIICCGFKRGAYPEMETAYTNYNAAIRNIATYFSLPYLNPADHEFFNSTYYLNNMVAGHPTAPMYSGYAKAMGDLISNVLKNNITYFRNYVGSDVYKSPIVLLNYNSSYTLENNTIVNLGEIPLNRGTYLVYFVGVFTANGYADGLREMAISGSGTAFDMGRFYRRYEQGSLNDVQCTLTTMLTVPNANRTYYLIARQSSGYATTITYPGVVLIKIA